MVKENLRLVSSLDFNGLVEEEKSDLEETFLHSDTILAVSPDGSLVAKEQLATNSVAIYGSKEGVLKYISSIDLDSLSYVLPYSSYIKGPCM